MLQIQTLHHVSLPATDLERSRRFYGDVLGLREIERPPFTFAGIWYELGDRQLHLVVGEHSTWRSATTIDSHDIHFAIRVVSHRRTVDYLKSKGYRSDGAADDPRDAREPGRHGGLSANLHPRSGPKRDRAECRATRLKPGLRGTRGARRMRSPRCMRVG